MVYWPEKVLSSMNQNGGAFILAFLGLVATVAQHWSLAANTDHQLVPYDMRHSKALFPSWTHEPTYTVILSSKEVCSHSTGSGLISVSNTVEPPKSATQFILILKKFKARGLMRFGLVDVGLLCNERMHCSIFFLEAEVARRVQEKIP